MKRPTYAAHIDECRLMSIILTDTIKRTTELLKFHIDVWSPSEMPEDWDGVDDNGIQPMFQSWHRVTDPTRQRPRP